MDDVVHRDLGLAVARIEALYERYETLRDENIRTTEAFTRRVSALEHSVAMIVGGLVTMHAAAALVIAYFAVR